MGQLEDKLHVGLGQGGTTGDPYKNNDTTLKGVNSIFWSTWKKQVYKFVQNQEDFFSCI